MEPQLTPRGDNPRFCIVTPVIYQHRTEEREAE
jgi:hypothetical protein